MNPQVLDEIAPTYLREQRLDLGLVQESNTRAFAPVVIEVQYTRTAPEGVMLPLVLEVQGPSPQSYQRRIFSHAAPASIAFTPREGGRHSVILREVAHNRWWGLLELDVEGELLEPAKSV
jgi:hypothetical protein